MATVSAHQTTADVVSPVAVASSTQEKTDNIVSDQEMGDMGKSEDTDSNSEHKQDGVRQIETITSEWSRNMLWVTFALLYIITFIDMLLNSMQTQLTPYVTSAFSKHSLVPVTSIIGTIVGGVTKLTLAKIIDIWGRVEGFIVMLILMIVGLIMKAVVKNVEMYAAAHTFYWVGHIGFIYVIDVVIADTTTLKNRMIMFGINNTPTIISTFAGPELAQLYLDRVSWRWAFGSFIIILVAWCVPVIGVFYAGQAKAKKAGRFPPRDASGRTFMQSVKYYAIQFDVMGMLLTTAGFALILLPMSIYSLAPNGWATDYIIAMIVVGVVCLALFVLWEKYCAPVSYLPFKYLKDRSVLGGAFTYGIMFLSVFCWDTYYSSYLQVVHFQSVSHSGFILNAFSLTSAFIAPFAGIMIRYFGTYKWQCIACSMPFCALGTGLLIYFRHPGTAVNWLVMCQVFNGIAGGFFSAGAYIAAMSGVTHSEIAVTLAIVGLFGSIGSSIGQSVAGAIWTSRIPTVLNEQLPADIAAKAYGSINVQLSYAKGSVERDAIIMAYGDAQRKMAIAGAAFIPLIFLSMLMWKNVNLKKLEETDDKRGKQAKGNVW